MKTPDKRSEKPGKGKVEGNAAEPDGLMRFRKVASAVLTVDRTKVLRAEAKERAKRKTED
ncbi:MAG: hypothetical protein DCF16_07340 [Alphaproteobacteria bacterium]|nr:MAG: hypothetical protein DCF16_07340 [Alphaproteobacteria bacterium]